jgi:hypothetical protein
VVLTPEWHETGQETKEFRGLYLDTRALQLLAAVQRAGVRPDGHVFGHAKGPWKADRFAKKIVHWLYKLGMNEPIIPPWARHVFCADAVIAGVSYEDLALLVGDTPEALRSAYGHVLREYLTALAEKTERNRVR